MIKQINGGVCAAKGFSANGVHCGIRKNRTKRDLALIDINAVCRLECIGNILCGYRAVELLVGTCGVFEYHNDILKLLCKSLRVCDLNVYLVLLGRFFIFYVVK